MGEDAWVLTNPNTYNDPMIGNGWSILVYQGQSFECVKSLYRLPWVDGSQFSKLDLLKLLGSLYNLSGVITSLHGIYQLDHLKGDSTFANPVDIYHVTIRLNIENFSSNRHLFQDLNTKSQISCDIPSSIEKGKSVTIFCKSMDQDFNSFGAYFGFVSDVDGGLLIFHIRWNPDKKHILRVAGGPTPGIDENKRISGRYIKFQRESINYEYFMSGGNHPTAFIRLS